MLFPVKFTVYIVYVQLRPNKLLNKSMVWYPWSFCTQSFYTQAGYKMTQLTGYDMTVGVKRSVTQSMPSYYHLFNLHFISFVNFFQSWFVIQATVHVTFFFKDVNINSPSSLPYSFYSLYNQTILCPLKFFLSSYHIPAFRCFKVNSYFVGTCKRKIRVEQVKSPKKTLFVCLFFHWIFSFPNIFTSTPTLDILLKLVFRYIRLETLIAFLNIFF